MIVLSFVKAKLMDRRWWCCWSGVLSNDSGWVDRARKGVYYVDRPQKV